MRPEERFRNVLRGVLLPIVALALTVPSVSAQPRPSFEPVPVWRLELDGQPVEGAQVYYSRQAGGFLVVADALPSPILLSARTRTVSPVQSLKLEPNAEGGYELLPGAVQGSNGSFQLQRGVVRFQVGDQVATLKQRSWLLGWMGREELLSQNVQYRHDAPRYAPDAEALERLRRVADEVRVDVYFGEWCPHCSEVMPKLLAVEEELTESGISFRHYGLPTRMGEDPVVDRLDIQGVPTGIVYRDGEEIGRIYGRPFEDPEQALLEILTSA